MKKYLVKTNGYDMVAMVDDNHMAYVFQDTAFDDALTIDYLKTVDFSATDGCESAEDIFNSVGQGNMDEHVFNFDEITENAEEVIEF